MFNINPLEIIVILALALIILGPQKFPEAGRWLGKAMREVRSFTDDLTRDVRTSFDEDRVPARPAVKDAVARYAEPEEESQAVTKPELESTAVPKADPPEENEPGPV